MYPDIFKIGWFELHTYGFLLMIAFILGIYLTRRFAVQKGLNGDSILDMAVVIVISSLVGSRFLYVIFHLDEFKGKWLDVISPFHSDGSFGIAGLSMLGGIVFAIVSCYVFFKIKKLPFLKIADVTAPSIALGVFIVRIGCFGQGCCFGKECDLPWGVVFPHNSPAGAVFPDVHVHPTQLYSSIGGLIIFIILLYLRRFQLKDGLLFYIFLMMYCTMRFFMEILRYAESEVIIVFGLTVNQFICISGFLFALISIFYLNHVKEKNK